MIKREKDLFLSLFVNTVASSLSLSTSGQILFDEDLVRRCCTVGRQREVAIEWLLLERGSE